MKKNFFFKRKILIILVTCTFLLVGFGCKGLSQTEQQLIKPVSLTYWTVYNDVETLRNFAKDYQALHPHITVNIKQIRYDEFDKLLVNALADDVAPDIISMHTRWLRKYTNRLMPMPASVSVANVTVTGKYSKETIVTQVAQTMPKISDVKSKFVGTVADDVIVGKDIYGLPLSIDTLAIYYNKDLLDKAGVPEAPKTWDEFLTAVKKSTKINAEGKIVQAGAALGRGKNVNHAGDILSLLMMQNKIKVAQGNTIVFASQLGEKRDKHPAYEALNFYADFAKDDKDVYTWNSDMGNSLDTFISGKAVFYIGYYFERNTIKSKAPQMNYEVIPVPQLDEIEQVNVANYWVETVVKKTKHKNEAWDFVRFITSDSNIAKYNQATKTLTPLRSQINNQKQDVQLGPFATQILNAKNWYRGKDIDTANKAFENLIDGFLSPYPEDAIPLERDLSLIYKAAQVIQQTM